jgi:hypothetical protein
LTGSLFFYGVLRPDLASGRMAQIVALLGDPRPATVPGRLYAVPDPRGHYPVMIAGRRDEQVRGIVMSPGTGFGPRELAELDAFEGFDPAAPERSDYVRRATVATIAGGATVEADAYWWNRAPSADLVAIPQGDFNRYLAESGAAPLPG